MVSARSIPFQEGDWINRTEVTGPGQFTDEVLVKVPGWAGEPNPMRARIVNLSGQGMSLLTQHPVQCGVHIEIVMSRGVVVGEVCRCRHEATGYSLGVRIKPEAA